jgi:hypothetical protein
LSKANWQNFTHELSIVEKDFNKSFYLLLISAKSAQRSPRPRFEPPPKIKNDPTQAPGIVYFADIDNRKALQEIFLDHKIRATHGYNYI